MTWSRAACQALDASDGLASLRHEFVLPEKVIYLDGNSLGALPKRTDEHLRRVVTTEWGRDLIGSWNTHCWIDAPIRVGGLIAPLIGASQDEVIVADTTTVNLFKLLAGALALRPGRRTIVSERGSFPTDLYILQGLRSLVEGVDLRIVPFDQVAEAIDDSTAVVLLSQVDYKSGRRWNMASLTRAAHARGALVLWDMCHSAGAINVDLNGCGADLAVGCGYKFLNGGPGAPGFLFVARRHQATISSPLTGWLGHATPFAFDENFRPASGIRRMLCSSPSILAIAALEAGLQIWEGVALDMVEAKSGLLGDIFIMQVELLCAAFGLRLASPRLAIQRGAQIAFEHPQAYAVMQALIAHGVIGDFREPNLIRFGFAPLTTRYVDAFDAAAILHDVLEKEVFRSPAYSKRAAVT